MNHLNLLHCLRGMGIAILLLFVVVCIAIWQFGSLGNTVSYLNGENYIVQPTTVDVGTGQNGEKKETNVNIRNLSFNPLRIVGMNASCNCLTAEELPIIITPRENRAFKLNFRFRTGNGKVEQIAKLLLEENGELYIEPIVITGQCIQK